MADASDQKARILLVDDSKLMRSAAQKMLGAEFDLATAEDGEAAWEQIQADASINVVFTDLSMPRLDGYGLLQRIRGSADPGIHDMPVIIVTGAENDDTAREQALELGATDFITKPFNSTDLLARARAHANYQRLKQKLQQQSLVDALTGLANKAGFLDRLQQDIAYAVRHGQPLSVARIELDGFKQLFLQHGRQVAEGVVAHVARIIRARIRAEDTAARINLASFALSLPASADDGAQRLAERICAEIRASAPTLRGNPLPLTVSAGVLTPTLQAGSRAEEVVAACQQLLEAALAAGGNRIQTAGGAAAPKAVRVRVDEVLDQLERGDTAAALVQLPQVLERLLPLLRRLNASQRAKLIRFLQELPADGG